MGSVLLIVPLLCVAIAAIAVAFLLYGAALGLGRFVHLLHACWIGVVGASANGSDDLGDHSGGLKAA